MDERSSEDKESLPQEERRGPMKRIVRLEPAISIPSEEVSADRMIMMPPSLRMRTVPSTIDTQDGAASETLTVNSNDFGSRTMSEDFASHPRKIILSLNDENSDDDNDDDNEDPFCAPTWSKSIDFAPSHEVDEEQAQALSARWAIFTARHPWTQFSVTMLLSIALSIVGIVVGGFTVTVDRTGWLSRGTFISDQQLQIYLVNSNTDSLHNDDNDAAWDDLLNNVQPGLENGGTGNNRRRHRALQGDSMLETNCEAGVRWFETNKYVNKKNLWPVWEIQNGRSALDGDVIRDICRAEQNTQRILQDRQLCGGCTDGTCMPPLSMVSFARVHVGDVDLSMSCEELMDAWEIVRPNVAADMFACAGELQSNYTFGDPLPTVCPLFFNPFLIDDRFGPNQSDKVSITSSVFATSLTGKSTLLLYEIAELFDRGETSDLIDGTYDTRFEDFYIREIDKALQSDMILAVVSAVITALAMLFHTRSLWVTTIGLIQIVLSFPLSYFFYSTVFRLSFFPFLNFLGVFIVFALGADDVFVSMDKWKNARLEDPAASTDAIAMVALPDAAKAMFLTTITTSVAFLGTAICAVTALKSFAIFLGVLVLFDYILCVLIVFPALCIYDRWTKKSSQYSCEGICCGQDRKRQQKSYRQSDHGNRTMVRRIFKSYFRLLHWLRYPILFVVLATFAVSVAFAVRFELPSYSGIRLLHSGHPLEQNFQSRSSLSASRLIQELGNRVHVILGILPADTGNHFDPTESSRLVLDNTFDPAPEENQLYLKTICEELKAQDFASFNNNDQWCPMLYFENWLAQQSQLETPDDGYATNCQGASALPVSPATVHACMISFVEAEEYKRIYHKDGKVKIIRFPYVHKDVSWTSGYTTLENAWHEQNDFFNELNEEAPDGVNNVFASSFDFWWYDTNKAMLDTAFGAVAIALSAAFLVVLISSRSIRVTLFAVLTIAFILTAVAALLVVSGWQLGFLECVCLAILIGMSCDFVLHIGHSYMSQPLSFDRHDRTETALAKMGPSILAAGFTTIAASIVMLFAEIVFFRRFALILLYSISVGLVGSLTVFIVLLDIFGPSNRSLQR